jgi:hypothetical protein
MSLAGAAIPAMLLAIAALCVAVIAIYLRARTIEAMYTTVPEWPRALSDEGGHDPAARIELVERLAIVAQPWCLDALREATKEERHPDVRKAIRDAWETLR